MNKTRQSVEAILESALALANLARDDSEHKSLAACCFRDVVAPLNTYWINLEVGKGDLGLTKAKYYYVSEGVKKALDEYRSGNIDEVPSIIREHHVPNKVLFDYIVENCFDAASIYEYLNKNMMLVAVTNEEDDKLKEKGLNSSIPETGCRYTVAGFSIYGIEKVTEFRV